MLPIIPPLILGQRYNWPPMFTEVPPGTPWHASWISRMVGALYELVGSRTSLEDPGCTASLEDSGAIVELVGTVSELVGFAAEQLDSSADEMASMTELLIGSWLRGISTTTWLELLTGDCCWLDVSGAWSGLELTGVCSRLELAGFCSLTEESEALSLLAGVASSVLLVGTVAPLDSGPVV